MEGKPQWGLVPTPHALSTNEVHSLSERSRNHSFVESTVLQDIPFTTFT